MKVHNNLMKNNWYKIIILLAVCLYSHTAFAYNTATSTTSGGNWSSTATWTGGVVPGDNYYVTIQGPVTIDQNVGTSVGVDSINLSSLSTASLSVNTSAPRTILFNSTTTPAGIYVGANAGAVSLVGTQADPITMEPVDTTKQIYIYENAQNTGANFMMKWADVYDLGTSTNVVYDGINVQGGFTAPNFDIENNRFTTSHLILLTLGGNITIKNNYWNGIDANTASNNTFIQTFDNQGNTDVENNVAINPTVPRSIFFNNIYPSASTFVFKNNSVMGTTSASLGLGSIGGLSNQVFTYNLDFSSTTGFTISDYPQAIQWSFQPASSTESNAVIEGAIQAVSTGNCATGTTATGNVVLENPAITVSQGVFQTAGYLAPCTFSYNILNWLIASDTAGNYAGGSFFEWGPTNATIFDHNTLVYPPGVNTAQANRFGYVIANGEGGGGTIQGSIDRNNIGVGSFYGIGSVSTDGTLLNFAPDFNGVGVHHNDIFNNATSATPIGLGGNAVMSLAYAFETSGTTHIVNGTTLHPDASYGDITADPQFLDSTRTMETYDSRVLGGPGTITDLFAQLAKQSGWGGTYTLSSTPVKDIHDWIAAGFAPTNPALATAASDGTTMGAVQEIVTPPSHSFSFSKAIKIILSAGHQFFFK